MVRHIIKLIAWHDNDWNGKQCLQPTKNIYCEEASGNIRKNKKKQCIREGGKFGLPCGWEISTFEENNWHLGADWRLDKNNIYPGQSLVFLLTKYQRQYYLVGIYLIERIVGDKIYAKMTESLKLGSKDKCGPFPRQTNILGVTVRKFGQGRTYVYIPNNITVRLLNKLEMMFIEQKKPQELIARIKWLKDHARKKHQSLTNRASKGNIDCVLNAIYTKPFVILSGISGTGKTQIARIISVAIAKNQAGK